MDAYGLASDCTTNSEDDFCKKHPVLCNIKTEGTVDAEICAFVGVGGCLRVSGGASKTPGSKGKPTFSFGGDFGFGVGLEGSVGAHATASNAGNADSNGYWRGHASIGAFEHVGGDVTYDSQNHNVGVTGSFGNVDVGANTNGSGSVGASASLGGSAFVSRSFTFFSF